MSMESELFEMLPKEAQDEWSAREAALVLSEKKNDYVIVNLYKHNAETGFADRMNLVCTAPRRRFTKAFIEEKCAEHNADFAIFDEAEYVVSDAGEEGYRIKYPLGWTNGSVVKNQKDV